MCHLCRITFEKSSIRDTTGAMSLAITPPEQQADKLGHKVVAIGGSFSPAVWIHAFNLSLCPCSLQSQLIRLIFECSHQSCRSADILQLLRPKRLGMP